MNRLTSALLVVVVVVLAPRGGAAEAPKLDAPAVWLAEAEAVARRIPRDPEAPLGVIDEIGEAQARAGDADAAAMTALRLIAAAGRETDAGVRAAGLLSGASILIGANRHADARAALDELEKMTADPNVRHWLLGELAIQEARLGRLDAARARVARINSTVTRALAWCELAEALLALGRADDAAAQLAEAEALIAKVDEGNASTVEAGAARAWISAGRFDRAAAIAGRSADAGTRLRIALNAARAQFAAKQTDAYRKTVAGVWAEIDAGKPADRVAGYRTLAMTQSSDAGDAAGALETLKRIEPAVATAAPAARRSFHFAVAAAHARAGDVAPARLALAAADAIPTADQTRAWADQYAIGRIAQAFSKAGRFDEALALCARTADPNDYLVVLSDLAEAGRVAQAVAQLPNVKDGWQRERATRAIARAWAARGDPPGLRKWCETLGGGAARAGAGLGAAEGLMKTRVSLQFVQPPPLAIGVGQ